MHASVAAAPNLSTATQVVQRKVMEEQLLYLSESDQKLLKESIAHQIRLAEENSRKPMGTCQLVWPHKLANVVHYFDKEQFHIEEKQNVAEDHFRNAKKYAVLVDYFGMEHNSQFCSSVPYLLALKSYTTPRYRRLNHSDPSDLTLDEYPFPLRFSLEGDIEEPLNPPDHEANMRCVFCDGLHPSDKCPKYRTPSERHVRLRNINYTLMVLGAMQICPACLKREVNHPEHQECMSRRSCENCTMSSHHTALCTSAPHIVARCSDSRKKKKLYPTLIAEIVFEDNMLREAEQAKIETIRRAIIHLASKDFLGRKKEAEAVTQPCEDQNNNIVLTVEEIAKSPVQAVRRLNRAEVHPNCASSVAINKVLPALLDFTFTRARDLPLFVNVVSTIFTDNEEYLKCGRPNCGSEGIAEYFCRCGLFRLCACCLFGRHNLTFKRQSIEFLSCPICCSDIPVPSVPGRQSYENYHRSLIVVQTLLCKAMSALLNWIEFSTCSSELVDFEETVEEPIRLLRNQFRCHTCNQMMDCETRLIMKSHCDCAILECRSCVLSKGTTYHKECGSYVRSYGTCIGLSVISIVCRIILIKQSSNNDGFLRQMFDMAMKLKNRSLLKHQGTLAMSNVRTTQPSLTQDKGVNTSSTVVTLTPWQKTLLSIHDLILKSKQNVNVQPQLEFEDRHTSESFVQDIEIAVRSVHDFSIDDGIVHIDVAEIQSSEDRIANTPHYGAEQFAEITQSVATVSEDCVATTPPYAAEQLAGKTQPISLTVEKQEAGGEPFSADNNGNGIP